MLIQINIDSLQGEEIIAIKTMVDALAREVVIKGKLKTLDAAEPVAVEAARPGLAEYAPEREVSVDQAAEIAAKCGANVEQPAKRTRKKIEPKPAEPEAKIEESATPPANTPATQPLPAAEQPAAPVSIDDLRSALQTFTSAKGMPAGIDLLKKHGCSRISELAAKDNTVKQAFLAEAAA
jgi:hypothetical protein